MSFNPPFIKWNDQFLHIYRGVVRNINDPNQAGRCQIEIWPMFFGITPTTDLPWAIPATNIFEGSGTQTGTFAVPQVGSLVWCFFEEGNHYQPVYFAEAPDLVHGVPAEALVNYPNRKVWKTVSGITMIFDNTDNSWEIDHPSGAQILLDNEGNIVLNSPNKVYVVAPELNTEGNLNVATGATGTFGTTDGSLVTVVNGVITDIN